METAQIFVILNWMVAGVLIVVSRALDLLGAGGWTWWITGIGAGFVVFPFLVLLGWGCLDWTTRRVVSTRFLSSRQLQKLAASSYRSGRCAALKNPKVPVSSLDAAVFGEDFGIRRSALSNPGCPDYLIAEGVRRELDDAAHTVRRIKENFPHQ